MEQGQRQGPPQGSCLGALWTLWVVVGFVLAITGVLGWGAYVLITAAWWFGMAFLGI